MTSERALHLSRLRIIFFYIYIFIMLDVFNLICILCPCRHKSYHYYYSRWSCYHNAQACRQGSCCLSSTLVQFVSIAWSQLLLAAQALRVKKVSKSLIETEQNAYEMLLVKAKECQCYFGVYIHDANIRCTCHGATRVCPLSTTNNETRPYNTKLQPHSTTYIHTHARTGTGIKTHF